MNHSKKRVVIAILGLLICRTNAWSAPFSVSYLDGSSWNSVFAQGFSPSVGPNPDPGLAAGDTVYLEEFQFFKSGNADSTANIQLAILNNIFGDLTGLSTSSPLLVGLSNNTIAGTASIATGDPITFGFDSLPLTYGNNFAAVFVSVGAGGALTPVLVPALVADYVETPPGSGSFHPETNYGAEDQFNYATSNFITSNIFGQFFNTFSFAGDANFRATLNAIPEPASLWLAVCAVSLSISRRRIWRS